jgi:hypothetical protein
LDIRLTRWPKKTTSKDAIFDVRQKGQEYRARAMQTLLTWITLLPALQRIFL